MSVKHSSTQVRAGCRGAGAPAKKKGTAADWEQTDETACATPAQCNNPANTGRCKKHKF